MSEDGPLDGVTVIEAGTMLSVPTVGRLLADFGAEVIKIERPGVGDLSREFGPQKDGVGIWWKYLGRNKKSITLNLKTDEAKAIFTELTKDADILLENFRPGTLEEWGIGYEILSDLNPGLVMLRLSGFGQTGPYSEKPGFGTLAEAMSGFATLNGYPDRSPLLPPTGLADHISALFGAFSVMYALYYRDANDGTGQYIDVSLIEPVLNILGPQPTIYDQLGKVEKRTGNQSTSSAPRNVYRTKDDEWVALSASAQPLAMRVFDAIGRPDLKSDPRFETNENRVKNKEELDSIIKEWMNNHTRDEIIRIFDENDATIAPVYDVRDIMNDEHYQARDAIIQVEDDQLDQPAVQNVFPKFSESKGRIDHLGPELGEHNHRVLQERLQYTEEQIEEFREQGVI